MRRSWKRPQEKDTTCRVSFITAIVFVLYLVVLSVRPVEKQATDDRIAFRDVFSDPIRKTLPLSKLLFYPSAYHTDFDGHTSGKQCQSARMSLLGESWIGPCGSIVTPASMLMVLDFPCPNKCRSFCGIMYQRYFHPSKRTETSIDLHSTAHNQLVQVVEAETLVPILFYWGHAFPHVVKDVMPRVAFALPYLEEHPEAQLLLDYSPSVTRFLARLGVDQSRVLFTEFHTPDTRSLYSPDSWVLYHAREVAYPHILPGPQYTGSYSSQMYMELRDALFQGKHALEATPLKSRRTILYISRAGGHNSSKRTILNEKALLTALREQLRGTVYELIVFTGSEMELDDTLALFHSARLVLGPHGGGFYNTIGCQRGTTVLEFVPDDYGKIEVGRFARKLHLNYMSFIKSKMKRSGSFGDIDIEWVSSLVQHILDGTILDTVHPPTGWRPGLAPYVPPRKT